MDPELLRSAENTDLRENPLWKEARGFIEASEQSLAPREFSPFAIGTRVRHDIFGGGTVLEVNEDRGAHLVKFDELPTPRAISFKAKLERE